MDCNTSPVSDAMSVALPFDRTSTLMDTSFPVPAQNTTNGEVEDLDASVGTVVILNVPIICLYVEQKERLCLAQISNTLLRDFSYNEIHNRRVALGITCLQCTPVQLEILRRTGAMPVSSRRCGLITKREAERLVKSFLEDVPPPKLPENFFFKVQHKCGWGCQGHFLPTRYNSSRAKCIKCTYCNSFFSPNKFIFHYHKTQQSTYKHPDAANFNSWRRHLHLVDDDPSESLQHLWEDVKAMFNGGCRKRVCTSSFKSSTELEMASGSQNCDEFENPNSSGTSLVNPAGRYLNSSLALEGGATDSFVSHTSFPSSPSPVTAGPYGNILRSLSMHYSPWWKSMYLPGQQYPNYNNAMALPFNVPRYGSIMTQSMDTYYNKEGLGSDAQNFLPTHKSAFNVSRKISAAKHNINLFPFLESKTQSINSDYALPYFSKDLKASSSTSGGDEQTISQCKANATKNSRIAKTDSSAKEPREIEQVPSTIHMDNDIAKSVDIDDAGSRTALTSDDEDLSSFSIDELRDLLTKARTCRVQTEKKFSEIKDTIEKLSRAGSDEESK